MQSIIQSRDVLINVDNACRIERFTLALVELLVNPILVSLQWIRACCCRLQFDEILRQR